MRRGLEKPGYQVAWFFHTMSSDLSVFTENAQIAISRKRHFRSPKRKTETTSIDLNTPQNVGKLTSETTFGHSKVVFRPMLRTKHAKLGNKRFVFAFPYTNDITVTTHHLMLVSWQIPFTNLLSCLLLKEPCGIFEVANIGLVCLFHQSRLYQVGFHTLWSQMYQVGFLYALESNDW